MRAQRSLQSVRASYSPVSTTRKCHIVREVFEQAGRYLEKRRYDIRIRAETVKAMADGLEFSRILDIGCGDGSISLPLLRLGRHLTLLDFSSSMTAIARSNVPQHLAASIDVRNEDFTTAEFAEHSFDLIICIGVMAHVDSPDRLLHKIYQLLKPNGAVILEFTDAYHPVSWIRRSAKALRRLVATPRYPVNLFSFRRVQTLLAKHHFRLFSLFCYGLPYYFGLDKSLTQETRYAMVRRIFGSYQRPRNRCLGNEYICVLKAGDAES